MKSLKKTKLTQLSKAEMEEKQMNATRGGLEAGCGGCNCHGNCYCSWYLDKDYWTEEDEWGYYGVRDNDTAIQGWYDSNTGALIEHQIVASQNGWDCYT